MLSAIRPSRLSSPKMHFLALNPSRLLVLSSLLLLFLHPIKADDLVFTDCLSSPNYTSGSQFETNLNSLLPQLSPDGAIDLSGYYNKTSGEDPDIIYGYSQCMSGAKEDVCRACLKNSTTEILQRCPNRKAAVIRYYQCILRYSHQPFFGQRNTRTHEFYRVEDASDPTAYNQQLGELMKELTSNASSRTTKYATGSIPLGDFNLIYGLAQCTRDLSSGECTACLQEMIGQIPFCCANRTGGNVYSVSCNIRYDPYLFFELSLETSPSAPRPSPPPPSPPPSQLDPAAENSQGGGGKDGNSKSVIIAVVVAVVAFVIIAAATCSYLLMKRRKSARGQRAVSEVDDHPDDVMISRVESMFFDLNTLKQATDDFSEANKLGQGGFGPVYKGKLSDGKEIAVKRLSTTSLQGMEELKNEVALVAKLQHRNLVRLWGCCMQQGEKLLVYEYVPNTSLDNYLFHPLKRLQLSWETRYKIIGGIARGLLYLHEDSRLRIIHRDMKASNVLLDGSMTPKIADFGMARLFGSDQTQGNTSRIAGTYGYMAPEYAMHGLFSTKSDVFSFGVLVLEIITGRKNVSFHDSGRSTNLLSYAWRHWAEGTTMEMVDGAIVEECSRNEVLRCIHMGLLCVQEDASERPSMSTVVLMLSSYSMTLPTPLQPAFLMGGSRMSWSSVSDHSQYSVPAHSQSSLSLPR